MINGTTSADAAAVEPEDSPAHKDPPLQRPRTDDDI